MPQSVTGDQLAERLEALDNHAPPEKDYVYVKNNMETPRTPDSANDLPSTTWEPTLSISTTEHWEKELLQDPKVCFILGVTFSADSKITEPPRSLRPLRNRPQAGPNPTVCRY